MIDGFPPFALKSDIYLIIAGHYCRSGTRYNRELRKRKNSSVNQIEEVWIAEGEGGREVEQSIESSTTNGKVDLKTS